MKKTIINFIVSLLLILIASPLLALEATDINQAIRDKGAHWVAGETSVSKLSPEEIRRRLMPIKFNKVWPTGPNPIGILQKSIISPLRSIGETSMATITSQA